jgi:hypothetical protein
MLAVPGSLTCPSFSVAAFRLVERDKHGSMTNRCSAGRTCESSPDPGSSSARTGVTTSGLSGFEPDKLADELEGSRSDLEQELVSPSVLAYRHGEHDGTVTVRITAVQTGFRAAFTTKAGTGEARTGMA